jgi:hypothetical protein
VKRATFEQFMEICTLSAEDQRRRGHAYGHGVEKAAAEAAMQQQEHGCGVQACITAIECVFGKYEVQTRHGTYGFSAEMDAA